MRGSISSTTKSRPSSDDLMRDEVTPKANCSLMLCATSKHDTVIRLVSGRSAWNSRRKQRSPHLFSSSALSAVMSAALFALLALTAGTSLPTLASAQPNFDDRRTNEDFLFDIENAPTIDVTPFQIRLFAAEGRNLQLSEVSIAQVQRVTQRHVDDQLRALYVEQGYQYDFVRLSVLDSSVVVRGDQRGGSGRRHALRGRRMTLRTMNRRSLQQDTQVVVNNDNGNRNNNNNNNSDDEGTAITLGGEIIFADRPVPEQWKIESNFLSAIRQYDDLREALLSSDDPALRLIDAVDVKSMASIQQGQQESLANVVEGGKDELPSWMDEVSPGNAEEGDDTDTDKGSVGLPPDSNSDETSDKDGPKNYPTGTAVSSEKGPSTSSSSDNTSGGGNSIATVVIAVLSVLLGLAAIAALTLFLVKRRNEKSDELITKWSVGEATGYETTIITPTTGASGSHVSPFANEDDEGKTKENFLSPADTAKTSQKSSSPAGMASSSSPHIAPPQQPVLHPEMTATSSGTTRQMNVTPRPNIKIPAPSSRSSFRSTSSGGTDVLVHALGPRKSDGGTNAKDKRGKGVIKMRSLASGVSRLPPTGPPPSTSDNKFATLPPLSSAQARLSRADSNGTKSTCSQDENMASNIAAGMRPGGLSTNDSLNSGSRPPKHMAPSAGAFPTSAPGSHYVRRNSLRSGASSSCQTSVDGDTHHHNGAYPGFPRSGIDGLHPMDWSCRGSDTEGEDGEAQSVSNSTLTTECPPNADAGAYPALPASLLDGGRANGHGAGLPPISNDDEDIVMDTESPGEVVPPQTREIPSDLISPVTGTQTMPSRASSSARSGEGANQLIQDLLWLEGRLARVQASKARAAADAAGQQNPNSLYSPIGKTSGNRDPYKDREAKRRKDTQSIVCRDCYAPPGKLYIVIHTTKDGPAIHSIREGSALEGHLFPEDLIVAVDDVDTRSFSAEEVIKMLSEKVDCERKITVLHFEDKAT